MTIGETLKAKRTENQLTQEQLVFENKRSVCQVERSEYERCNRHFKKSFKKLEEKQAMWL